MSKQSETAYQFIKQKILDGTFKPSQKLIENDLVESIGVSRSTVKKALLRLEQEHLVNMEENKGATIKSYTLEEVIHYLEILEVLEGLVVKSAIPHISDSELRDLEKIIEKMELYLGQNKFEEYSSLSINFHHVIYKAAKNQQAVKMIDAIRIPLKRYQLRTILLPGIKEHSIMEHRKVFEALKNRNEKEAVEAITSDSSIVREAIEQNYQFLF